MREETLAALTLRWTPRLGRRRLQRLLERLGSPVEVLRQAERRGRRWGLPEEARASLRSGRSRRQAEAAAGDCRRAGIQILSPWEPDYPPLLAAIHDPPLVLYLLGEPGTLSRPCVSMVGSRRCSLYGRQVAFRLAAELAALGLCVVSGLARGVDTEAHRGALDADGATAAVLGSGVDVPYPRENRPLYEQIRKRGCLLSEFPRGAFPAPRNFPVRNRVISGLSLGTLVVEGAESSGSLITARLALEQDRELWAVPGPITSRTSHGPNRLIQQGAVAVMEAQDVLEALPLHVLEALRESRPPPPGSRPETGAQDAGAGGQERKLLDRLAVDRGKHPDELLEETGLDPARLGELLLRLELSGEVLQLPGNQYCRKLEMKR